MTKRNQYIDLLKFIFSISVIGIHCQIFYNTNWLLYKFLTMGLLRIIPPFFFTVSGYYFFNAITTNKQKKDNLFRYFILLMIFETIELIIYKLFGCNILDFSLRIITVGIGGIYWYIISLIFALLISKPFYKKKHIVLLLILGSALYLIAASNDVYGNFFVNTDIQKFSILHTNLWSWPQAGLSMSLLFVSLGAFINKHNIKIHNPIYVIISIFIFLCEVYICQSNWAYDANCYISLILVVPIIVSYILNINNVLIFDTRLLSNLSIYIYFIHPIIIFVLKNFMITSNDLLFIVTVFFTIPLAYISNKIIKI